MRDVTDISPHLSDRERSHRTSCLVAPRRSKLIFAFACKGSLLASDAAIDFVVAAIQRFPEKTPCSLASVRCQPVPAATLTLDFASDLTLTLT